MNFANSTAEDLDDIFRLYAAAIEFQKKVSDQSWLAFEREFIEKEIAEKRHWKITIDGEIACIFSTSFDDSLIWQEKNNAESIYLHRVAVNPEFRVIKFFPKIVEWLREYAKNLDKKYIRLDTWSDNKKLFDYYKRSGFEFLGVMTLRNSADLPKHYEGISLCLFEIKVNQMSIKLLRTDSDNTDFRALVALLDAELAVRDGAEHAFYARFNKIDRIRHAVVAYKDEKAVGCGALREYEPNVAEIKRMYVREEMRGRGVAGKVLAELENWAKELGFSECILETSVKQPEAIGLYKKHGYRTMPSYGQYLNVENSVCLRKSVE